jgi:cell division septation protein DedD
MPDENEPGASQETPATGAPGGGYSVCVASYSSQEAARRDQPLYQKLGQIFIVAADIPGKGRWYRICVGRYNSRAQAHNQASQWRDNGTAKGAFAVTLPGS